MHLIWGDFVPEPQGVVEGHRWWPQAGCAGPQSPLFPPGATGSATLLLAHTSSVLLSLISLPHHFSLLSEAEEISGCNPRALSTVTVQGAGSGSIRLHLACWHFRPFAEPFGVQDYLELTPRIWSHVGKGKVFSLSSLLSPGILPFIPPGAGAFALSRDPHQSQAFWLSCFLLPFFSSKPSEVFKFYFTLFSIWSKRNDLEFFQFFLS